MESPMRMTILCVEDEIEQLELRRLLFEYAGFQFLGARTGGEALALFRATEVSAVVLDYWMAGMNGLAVAEVMKRERPAIPIIMLSGFGALPGEGLGIVDAWFQKTQVEPEELTEHIKNLIKRKTGAV